jgi:hypothetical protein
MAASLTGDQARRRTGTVVRQVSWRMLRSADRLSLWRAAMSRRRAGPLKQVGLARYGSAPCLGVVELACDHFLDLEVKRGVWAEDELAQHRDQGAVLAGQLG